MNKLEYYINITEEDYQKFRKLSDDCLKACMRLEAIYLK